MNCHSIGRLRAHYPTNNAKHREDIAGLANYFLNKYCRAMQADHRQSTPAGFTKPAKLYLARQSAVTRKRNQRVVASVRGKSISADHLDVSPT